MRTAAFSLAVVLVVSAASVASAQSQPPSDQPDPQPPAPHLKWDIPVPLVTPETRRLGVFTLMPPATNGQIIGVGVPVGALVMGAVTKVRKAQHRRAERAARVQVQRELQDFLNQQLKIKN